MTRFQKVFLRDQLGDKVYAAAFGKHPAWDDHIDDVGISTGYIKPTVVRIKMHIARPTRHLELLNDVFVHGLDYEHGIGVFTADEN